MDEKIDLEQKITELQQSGNNWLEPMREFIKASSQAKNSVNLENNQELLSFLKNIASNFLLKGKKFRFEAKIGWRVLAQSAPFSNWRRGRDSNPRYPCEAHTLSRRARSTAPAPLRSIQ